MDFANRSGQPAAPSQAPRPAHTSVKKSRGKVLGIVSSLLVVAVAILLAALALYIAVGGKQESDNVAKDKFQAVFLNGGQVYFGKIRELNGKFVTMDNIYYLRVNQQVQPEGEEQAAANQNISLAKLGCELHGPEDKMVINREQITFWENLKTDGQVAKAIAEYVKQYPEGQKCSEPQQNQNQ